MAKKKARRFDLSSFKGLDIQSFAIAEVTGEDLVMAAERCSMPDGTTIDENTFSLMLRQQMIAGAIVEVDGQPIKGASCQSFLKWNARTRGLVAKAYEHMNGNTAKDLDAFQKLLDAPDEEPVEGALSEQT